MNCEWPRARYALNIVAAPAESDNNNPLMQPYIDYQGSDIQSDLATSESEHSGTTSNEATSTSTRSRSFWSEEEYDLARESDSTSQASSGNILYPNDADITSISSDDGLY